MKRLNNLYLASLLAFTPLLASCQDAGVNPTPDENILEAEDDVRLDSLIDSFTGDLIEFPVDYNQYRLDDLGAMPLSSFAYSSQVAGMESHLPYSATVLNGYQYGDSVYIVSDDFEDAEYVARAIELIKRKVPSAYEHLIAHVPGIDYTVFSFHDVDTGNGDWFNNSLGRSLFYDTTGNNVSFIIGSHPDILAENTSGVSIDPSYASGVSDDERYDLIMKEIFVAVGLHESLHAYYHSTQPSELDPNNTGSINIVVEHLNVYSIQKELAQELGASQFYLDSLQTGIDNLATNAQNMSLLNADQVEDVKSYRPF